ncbi:MAG: M23 family metallopeptidase [Myxococcales bacterium]|nr:M23 family metallopeptidase [Myxococcales bacterium]MDH5308095.1 M23 family metallopeptidase [Myxococcales bacterium]MDH5565444.1 M23 family metallopeptidase [Myxococcales bacterium]
MQRAASIRAARVCTAALGAGLALLAGISARAAGDRLCLDGIPVCVETRTLGAATRFVVSNESAAPYSVRIRVTELENAKPLAPLPFRGVVEPGTEQVVGSLAALDPSQPTHHSFAWRAALGSMLARHDDRWHYRMPFGGAQPRSVSQGYGGSASHQGAAQYSLDFAMPWGTPVLAARAGTVVNIIDSDVAGVLRKTSHDRANRVEVLHADGTLATYAHLRHGAIVSLGQWVDTGDPIGFSGDTGFSGGPHLHFMVWKRLSDLSMATLPVRFHDGTARGMLPIRGLACAPGCTKTGTGCDEDEAPPPSEALPAAPAAAGARAMRRSDGGCVCANGAVIYVDLPCALVCGR